MLKARSLPRVCHSCRYELLSIFTNGLVTRPITRTPRSIRLPLTSSLQSVRPFTSAARRLDAVPGASEETASHANATSNIESVVRQARQTFGETLPKGFLSLEEYALYERLYGPPLRDTQATDLEYLSGDGIEENNEAVRNVLLRVNDEGEFEEVEFDPALGFRVHESADQDLSAAQDLAGNSGGHVTESTMEDLGLLADSEEQKQLQDGQTEEHATDTLSSQQNTADGVAQSDGIEVLGRNQREVDAITRLQKDMDAAAIKASEEEDFDEEYEELEEDIEEDEEFEENDEPGYVTSDSARTHPHTRSGRFGTFPSTLSLPKRKMLDPVAELLERTNMKHVQEAAEKAFGGKGLPDSPSTRTLKGPAPQRHIPLDASQHKMTELEADTYLAAVMPQTYAAVMSTLVEVRKRLGSTWLRNLLSKEGQSPRVLDAGAGGAGAIAWQEIVQAEWDLLQEEGTVKGKHAPVGKTTVLTGSPALRNRVSRFLDDTTFLPRLPDYVHASRSEVLLDGAPPQARKTFDLIIAPHTMFPLKEEFRRKNMVENLWSLLDPNGGVLILIEKGVPRGFEAIASARSQLLTNHIKTLGEPEPQEELVSRKRHRYEKETGMIVAPCTNHTTCPMYPVPGLSSGRKDFCHFGQRFIRPAYLQRVLGASVRNHEDVKFSYIAVRKGVDGRQDVESPILQGDEATERAFRGYEDIDLPDAVENAENAASDIKFHSLSLPRSILPALKRRGHVTMDLCTPSGQLERWTVPKSFSKAAHRDARKSQWGDLWALGAKTRTPRAPRLGRLGKEAADGTLGHRSRKKKIAKYDIIMGREGMEGIKPAKSSKYVKPEKRTKGGRIWKQPKPIGENDL